jgi:hypothetical protein
MVIGSFSRAWMMKLETAQPSCACMSEPQGDSRRCVGNQDFRLVVAFDRFCPVCHQTTLPAAQQPGYWTSSPKAALYPEGVPTKG